MAMHRDRGIFFKTPLKDISNLEPGVIIQGNVFDKECDAASVLANSLFTSALHSPYSSSPDSISGNSFTKILDEPRIRFYTSPRSKRRIFAPSRSSTKKMFAYSFSNLI
jgi:hypothetical protein